MRLTRDLVHQTIGLGLVVAEQIARSRLDLAADVARCAFDTIVVHNYTSVKRMVATIEKRRRQPFGLKLTPLKTEGRPSDALNIQNVSVEERCGK
ncbi:hypothetical protein [Lichenihabitans psoromatis]|uniref:hypothetical protein n=1 Tax=Lichenihabitans psoromatis TaxID=2528642 RepID=UPI001FE21B43|nr:hypothetical protein [Lichenihabitans psoromatis]